jgi:pimeloyl-ACP methyl ester carboxylesterase
MSDRRRASGAALAGLCLAALVACGSDGTDTSSPTTQETTVTTTRPSVEPTVADVAVRGTTLHVEQRGDGPALLLVHGGGEDAAMLAAQAEDLAAAGYRVITYDRRGTGRSGRDDWPGDGADQHADDAAALLGELEAEPAVVVGVSSGGVVALAVAARHPEAVDRVVAWEPPALGVLPGAAETNDQIMAPIEAHLAAHPGDYVGAQALLLTAILGFPVAVDDPAFAAARANAEPMIRDEPTIAVRPFAAGELAGLPITVAVGSAPNEIVAAAAGALTEQTGSRPVTVDGDHEIYLTDPTVLTGVVGQP